MKVIVNAGHTKAGTKGSGAVGYLVESNETRAVSKELIKLLKEKGYTVIDATVDTAFSQSDYLKKAVSIANSKNGDLFLSIHFNAGGGKGVEAYTWRGEQVKEAVSICKGLNKLGFRNRGVKDGSGMYVIKKTKMKAVLLEVCFVDTKSDVDLYKKLGAKKIAEVIAASI